MHPNTDSGIAESLNEIAIYLERIAALLAVLATSEIPAVKQEPWFRRGAVEAIETALVPFSPVAPISPVSPIRPATDSAPSSTGSRSAR